MPAKPSWYGDLDTIIVMIQSLPTPYVDRATIETLLGVGRRRAQQILLPCISYRTGSSGLADREALIERLRGIAKSDESFFEANRRRKLGEALGKLRSQKRVLVEAPTSVINTRFENLPEGVVIEAGRITVSFEKPQEALEKLLALAMAIGNDLEAFERAVK